MDGDLFTVNGQDEVTTGTYVTVSAFQMGIGSGSCGPNAPKKVCYPVNREYTLRFLIQLEKN